MPLVMVKRLGWFYATVNGCHILNSDHAWYTLYGIEVIDQLAHESLI